MPIKHANDRFDVFGVEFEKLYNLRNRITIHCDVSNRDEDWFYENEESFWKDYGDLYSVELPIGDSDTGWEPLSGEEYPDMRLINVRFGFLPSIPDPKLTFTYETLGSTFVKAAPDKVDHPMNNLRRVTRTVIAKANTVYSNVVGVSTITHNLNPSAGTKTLYLASYEMVQDDESHRTVKEMWMEAGEVSESKSNLSSGVVQVTKGFLFEEAEFNGPVTRRTVENVGGFKVITVTRLQDKDGNSIVENGENLVHSFSSFQPFEYPGIVSLNTNVPVPWVHQYSISIDESPVTSKVLCTVYVFFQTSPTIDADDYTYDQATDPSDGLWSPNKYARFEVNARGSLTYADFFDTQGLRNFRCSSNSTSGSFIPGDSSAQFYWQGARRLIDNGSITFSIDLSEGPPDPVGNKYVLHVDVQEAFSDVDGNTYYKKTIIKTDAIPAQTAGELPYD